MAWKYKQPAPRPSWWSPEKVLECLQNGERVSHVCKRASDEMGGAISASRLRHEVSEWSGSLSWGEPFTAALAIWTRGAAPKISTEWYDDFYDAMREAEGKVAEACDAAGIGPDLVYALRDKRNGCYDKVFDEQVRILEGMRFSVIRENLLKQAEVDSADGGKLAAKVLESSMPSLHAPKQQLEVSGRIEHDHAHTHRILPPEVVAASQARTRALFAGRQRAELPTPQDESLTIDAILVGDKATAQ